MADSPSIKTNPDTGVRYYDELGVREGQSVDLFVPVRGDVPTNPGGARWPNLFGLPYDGAEIKFYLKGEPKVREYDPAMFYEVATWGPVEYAAPKEGGPAGTWEETLEVKRRPVEELLNQVEAARLQANARLYPSNEDPMLGVLLAEAIRRDAEGTATPFMVQLLERHQALVAAGFANMERAAELKAQVEAELPFDLSAGWVNELPA
jgi:hypothetical protein